MKTVRCPHYSDVFHVTLFGLTQQGTLEKQAGAERIPGADSHLKMAVFVQVSRGGEERCHRLQHS